MRPRGESGDHVQIPWLQPWDLHMIHERGRARPNAPARGGEA